MSHSCVLPHYCSVKVSTDHSLHETKTQVLWCSQEIFRRGGAKCSGKVKFTKFELFRSQKSFSHRAPLKKMHILLMLRWSQGGGGPVITPLRFWYHCLGLRAQFLGPRTKFISMVIGHYMWGKLVGAKEKKDLLDTGRGGRRRRTQEGIE